MKWTRPSLNYQDFKKKLVTAAEWEMLWLPGAGTRHVGVYIIWSTLFIKMTFYIMIQSKKWLITAQ